MFKSEKGSNEDLNQGRKKSIVKLEKRINKLKNKKSYMAENKIIQRGKSNCCHSTNISDIAATRGNN